MSTNILTQYHNALETISEHVGYPEEFFDGIILDRTGVYWWNDYTVVRYSQDKTHVHSDECVLDDVVNDEVYEGDDFTMIVTKDTKGTFEFNVFDNNNRVDI